MSTFAVVIACAVLPATWPDPAAAAHASRLRELIRGADLIGSGSIIATEEHDHGRIRVYDLRLERDLKAGTGGSPQSVRAVAITDQPGELVTDAGASGVAFLRPLRRMSYFDQHLGDTKSLLEFVDGRDGWLQVDRDADLAAVVAPIAALLDESRKPERDAAVRGQKMRSLVFALLTAPHPLLARDGIDSLSAVPDLAVTLSEGEKAAIAAALDSDKLPLAARERLIEEIVGLQMRAMIGALRDLREPDLRRQAWAALRELGAPVDDRDLRDFLANDDPRIRSAAAQELLASNPSEAIPLLVSGPLRDRDKQVRLDTIEALGESGLPDAVGALEGVFAGPEIEDRQAAARALLAIGGDPAADALARLAFVGPIDSQRYAVVILLSLGIGVDDPRVRRIAARHTDEKITEMLEHGVHLGHSH